LLADSQDRDVINSHVMQDTALRNKYLLVYGSETGQSEAISERIASDSVSLGIEAELFCGDQMLDQMYRLNSQVLSLR
jgi:hypothetical protein